jgi:glucose-6-phosphate isomerase
MTDHTTIPVPPVILTPRPDEGRLEGGNARYEKRLADLAGVYRDQTAYRAVLGADDGAPVYWVESSTTENGPGGLITGISVLEPGRVGDEYAMTRGHLHAISDRS